MDLNNLKPAEGSTKNRKRIARGTGSGRGGTATSKGGFEGGQMPLQRRVPKFGFTNPNRIEHKGVNLDTLQELIDKLGVDTIDRQVFLDNGLAQKNDLIKILGRGVLTSKVNVTAHGFSSTAVAAIEKEGGTVTKL
jgi:large subunit ribosomal protein L15